MKWQCACLELSTNVCDAEYLVLTVGSTVVLGLIAMHVVTPAPIRTATRYFQEKAPLVETNVNPFLVPAPGHRFVFKSTKGCVLTPHEASKVKQRVTACNK